MTMSNVVFFKLSTKKPSAKDIFNSVKVSVLIPARNEEKNIAACLESFVNQTHRNYEVIVLDDNSADKTYEIAAGFMKKIRHLKIIRGLPLKKGWNGKQYACHQLAQAGTGDVFCFVDADTRHSKDSISFGLTNLFAHKSDFLSGYPRQLLCTFGEAFIVPLLYLLMTLVQPFWLLKRSKHGFAAIGQFIMVKRSVYFGSGGFAAIPLAINDDVQLASLIKSRGYTGIFLDLQNYVSVRMYSGFKESFAGISKNIFPALGGNIFIAALIPLFTFFLVLAPFTVLILSFFFQVESRLALIQIALMTVLSLVVVIDRKLPAASIAYPVTYTLLGIMGINSVIKIKTKQGFVWRGRTVM